MERHAGELQELVRRAQAGDAAATEELLVRHLPDLEFFLRHHGSARVLARESHADVVQSVCREVLGGLGDFEYRGPSSFRNWLFQAALNKVIDKHRYHAADMRDGALEAGQTEPGGRSPVRDAAGDGGTPSEEAMAREDAARLERALAALPKDYRDVILLARFQGCSHEEIATRLGRTVEASRTLLRRALIRLSGELAQGGGPEPG